MRLHKPLILILVIMLLFSTQPSSIFAAEIGEPNISARNAIIINAETGMVLYEKKPDDRVAMASTTKLMTIMVVLEQANLEDVVVISKKSATVTGSTIHLAEGEKISVQALLYGLMLNSGNDAAIALAEHVSGSVEEFCVLMNNKAFQIGARNSSFTSPHGLDNLAHYTTARDLSLIAMKAFENPIIRKIVSTKSIELEGHSFRNTNDLLFNVAGVTGGKTGFTNEAGRCMVISAESEGFKIISVVLGCDTKEQRTSDATKLVKYALENFTLYEIFSAGTILGNISIKQGQIKSINLVNDQSVRLSLTHNELDSLRYEYQVQQIMPAPVVKGSALGKLNIFTGDKLICTIDLVADMDSAKKEFVDYMRDLFSLWVFEPFWQLML